MYLQSFPTTLTDEKYFYLHVSYFFLNLSSGYDLTFENNLVINHTFKKKTFERDFLAGRKQSNTYLSENLFQMLIKSTFERGFLKDALDRKIITKIDRLLWAYLLIYGI